MANSTTSELKVTRQKALTLALRFMLKMFKNVTISQLEKEHRLSRKTLYRILNEEEIPRCSDDYMCVFVCILNAKRRSAQLMGNHKLEEDIDHLLRDLMLVQYGVPTDDEILHFEHQQKIGVSYQGGYETTY